MSGHGEKLTRTQEQAISALLTTRTIRDAASQVGIGEATLRRWLAQPTFGQAYRDARRQILTRATDLLAQASIGAVFTLASIMANPQATATARVSAARTVLEMAYRASELDDLAAHVEEVDARLQEVQPAKSYWY